MEVRNSFSQATLRVITEGFLKLNAKTAFFKAIFRFVTVDGTREVHAVAGLLPVLQFYTCLIY